jgi:hypothetical protein
MGALKSDPYREIVIGSKKGLREAVIPHILSPEQVQYL